jgi:hypothetical protein
MNGPEFSRMIEVVITMLVVVDVMKTKDEVISIELLDLFRFKPRIKLGLSAPKAIDECYHTV